ncbi:MAG: lipid II flippase MurJ [bacterium]
MSPAHPSLESAPTRGLRHTVLRLTLALLAISVVAKFLNILSRVLITKYFGAGVTLDAYLYALLVPTLVVTFIINLLDTLIVSHFSAKTSEKDAQGALNTVLTFSAALFLLCSLTAFVFARPIIRVLAPFAEPEMVALASRFLRILAAALFFLGLEGIASSALLASHRYLLASLSKVVRGATMVAFLVLGYRMLKDLVLPVAVAVSSLAGMTIAVFFLSRRHSIRPNLEKRNPLIEQIRTRLGTVALLYLVINANSVVEKALVSRLPAGSLSTLDCAFLLFFLPHLFIAESCTFLFFPKMAAAISEGKTDEMRRLIRGGMLFLLFFLLPAMLAIFYLRGVLTEAAYQRGKFDAADAGLTTTNLGYYAFGLCAYGLNHFFSRVYFATRAFSARLRLETLFVALNILLNVILIEWLGAKGVALATTLAFSFLAIAGYWDLRRRIGPLGLNQSLGLVARIVTASLMMVIVVAAANKPIALLVEHLHLAGPSVVRLLLLCATGLAAYVWITHAFGLWSKNDLKAAKFSEIFPS